VWLVNLIGLRPVAVIFEVHPAAGQHGLTNQRSLKLVPHRFFHACLVESQAEGIRTGFLHGCGAEKLSEAWEMEVERDDFRPCHTDHPGGLMNHSRETVNRALEAFLVRGIAQQRADSPRKNTPTLSNLRVHGVEYPYISSYNKRSVWPL
jgi:hypothetical protein